MNRYARLMTVLAAALLLATTGFSATEETTAQDSSVPQTPTALFDQGTRALETGDFAAAVAAYDQARAAGHVSAELLHNTGVAWYRLDNVGRAILFLERARQLEPKDERIAHSLLIAQRLRKDTFSTIPTPFWQRAHQWILRQVSPGLLFGIGAGLLLLWGGAVGARLLARRPVPFSSHLERWSLTLALPLILFALFSSVAPPWPESAIVLAESVELTEQAASESAGIERLHAGTEVHVRARGDGWVLVRLTNGVEGWLPTGSIESV